MLNIGDIIQLEPKYSENGERYKCKLVDRKGDILYIDYPINEQTGRTTFLLDGAQLRASFVGTDTSVYFFETEVLGRSRENIPMIHLGYPGNDHLIRIQRRQFVRVETPVDAAVHSNEGRVARFTTITSDISAGGAAILLPPNVQLNPDAMLTAWFVIPMQTGDYHYLKTRCRVIRTVPGNGDREKASLEFVDMPDSDRQILIKFCFERQLAMRD